MAVRVVMPSFGMYTAEGTVAAWLAAPGSAVAAGEPILEITTEKASYAIDAPAAGTFQPVVELGVEVPVEGLIALVLAPGETLAEALAGDPQRVAARDPAPPAGAAPPPEAAAEPGRSGGAERALVSPLARRLAAELGVDLAAVVGSGPGGRVVEADVRAAAARRDAGGEP